VVCPFYHRDGVDLHITQVIDRFTCPRQATPMGLRLQQALRGQGQAA